MLTVHGKNHVVLFLKNNFYECKCIVDFSPSSLTLLDVVLYAHVQAWNDEVSDELKRIVLQFENLSRLTQFNVVSVPFMPTGELSDSGNS